MGKKVNCHLTGRGGKVDDGNTDWSWPVSGPVITQNLLPGDLKLNQVLGVRVKHEVHHSGDVYAGCAADPVWAGGGGVEMNQAGWERNVRWPKTHN